MKVVSETSAAEIERRRKEQERERLTQNLEWRLRELTANLLRVCRGAGKPYEIGPQANALVAAFMAFFEATGQFPDNYHLTNMLHRPSALESFREKGLDPTKYRGYLTREEAKQTIVRGALQMVASDLLGQTTQIRRGEDELHQGIRALDEWHGHLRAQRAQEERERRRQARTSRKRNPKARKTRPKTD